MRLVVTTATRDRLDPLFGSEQHEVSVHELVRQAEQHQGLVWLTGGEPTLRADLPELIAAIHACAPVGLVTDGLPLSEDRALRPLVKAGLSRVRLRLHAHQPSSHDWLVELRGAFKRVFHAARRAREHGLSLEVEARLTRPTLGDTHRLVHLASELDATRMDLHPVAVGAAGDATVALVARFGLVAPHLERAAAVARSERLALHIVDMPRCVLGQAADLARTSADAPASDTAVRCSDCPSSCGGFSEAYIRAFGRSEVPTGLDDATDEVFDFGDAPTRSVRLALVQLAKRGVQALRVGGQSMSHPDATSLLRETTLLFERVEVCGAAHGLDRLGQADLFALSAIERIDGHFFGATPGEHDEHVGIPGAFEAAARGLRRFAEVTAKPTRAMLADNGDWVEAPELLEEHG